MHSASHRLFTAGTRRSSAWRCPPVRWVAHFLGLNPQRRRSTIRVGDSAVASALWKVAMPYKLTNSKARAHSGALAWKNGEVLRKKRGGPRLPKRYGAQAVAQLEIRDSVPQFKFAPPIARRAGRAISDLVPSVSTLSALGDGGGSSPGSPLRGQPWAYGRNTSCSLLAMSARLSTFGSSRRAQGGTHSSP